MNSQSSAPEYDYDSSFEAGKFCANKVREYDELISKVHHKINSGGSDYIDIIMLHKMIHEREHYRKETIIFARMCNYFKNLQKHK
jgi:hypothetical protein